MPDFPSIQSHLGQLAQKARDEAARITAAVGHRTPAVRFLLGAAGAYEQAAGLCREGDDYWLLYAKTQGGGTF